MKEMNEQWKEDQIQGREENTEKQRQMKEKI